MKNVIGLQCEEFEVEIDSCRSLVPRSMGKGEGNGDRRLIGVVSGRGLEGPMRLPILLCFFSRQW